MMATYAYKARDTLGKQVRGTMEAAGKTELIDKLRKMGYMTTHVRESAPGITLESIFDKFKPLTAEGMIMLYVQLSNMINAGIPIMNALHTVNKQVENKKLKEALGNVVRRVESGDSFSKALAGHPAIFQKLFINMVKAGEASGRLDAVLERFAGYFEYQLDLKEKIKGALFYPAILLVAGITVTLFVVTFIIPQFVEIFMKSGIKLPMPTLILYRIGTWIKHYWSSGLFIIVLAWLGIRYYIKTERGRLRFDRLKLGMPVFGTLYRRVSVSRFTRTLGTLVASGVPILESLDITREVVGNEVLGSVITAVRNSVEKGERLSEPLKISSEFPSDAVQMISVGEETGRLDEMLYKTADFYDMTVGYTVKKLTTILEPLLLVIMGCLVAFIMASMLLPIFDMIKMLKR